MPDRRDHEDLLARLEAFEFDPPGTTLTFAARLARESGWSRSRALRVLGEYRRFLYLACVAGHVVTPSEDVDRAWHLHLTYTRSYWQDLCRDTLGRDLHHDPTAGGADESKKYLALYEATRATYAETFGEPPPLDVWSEPETRFGEDLHARWVNVRRNWVLPRPRFLGRRAVALGVAPPAALLALGAFPNPFDFTGPEFLLLYLVLLVMAVIVSLGARARSRGPIPPIDPDTLDSETAAVLAHGEPGAGRAALARLLFEGTLEVDGDRVCIAQPIARDATRVERAIVERAGSSGPVTASEALEASAGAAADLRARMEVQGLLETDETFAPARRVATTLFLALLGFGAIRVAVGFVRERPVLLLVALMVAAAIALFALRRRPFRTRFGETVLARLRRRVPRPKEGMVVDDVAADAASTAVGLWGGTAIMDARLAPIAGELDPPAPETDAGAAWWAAGCSADGGGGCGGGGCGGCGG